MSTLKDLVGRLDPFVELVTIGGIPIEMLSQSPRNLYLAMLGTGALLTRRNPRGWTYAEAGAKCEQLGHLWTEHVILVGVAIRAPRCVRDAFAFDRRFHLSWVEDDKEPDATLATFTATGPMREFRRYVKHRDSQDFASEVREVMRQIKDVLSIFEVKK